MSENSQNTSGQEGQATVQFQAGPSVDATPTPQVGSQDVAAVVAMNDAPKPIKVADAAQAAAVSSTIAVSDSAVSGTTVGNAPYTVTVRAPEGKGMLAYLVGPGAHVVFQGFDVSHATFAVEAGNLRVTLPSGAEVLLLDFVSSAHAPAGLTVVSDEGTLTGNALLASLNEETIAANAKVQPAEGDVISHVAASNAVGSREGFIVPGEAHGGFQSNEGVFSTVLGPYALPFTRDHIEVRDYNYELAHIVPPVVVPVNDVDAVNDVYSLAARTPATLNVLANDFDPQGDTFGITSFTQPAQGSVALVNGEFVYTPTNARGAYDTTFTYTITDSKGATDTATVSIHVDAKPNSVDAVDDVYTLPDHTHTATLNVVANDSDPQGDTFSITSFTQPAHGSVALVNGEFQYTPEAGLPSYDTTFTYTITDALGATDTATVTIHVPEGQPVNSVDAVDDVYTLPTHNTVATLDVVANDRDPQGDTFIITGFTQPAHGSVALVNDQFVYTPEAGRTAYDTTFTYTITDSKGATDSATVTIHVPAADNSVDARDDVYTLTSHNAVTTLDVKANDVDPQGDAFTISSFTQPAHGSVALVNDQFVYTPEAGRSAYDTTFTYTITDALGATDTATVTIHVPAAENNVDARDDVYTLTSHNAVTTLDVKANDVDPQGDTFTITSFTQPAHGSVALVNDQFVYTPEAGRSAYDTTFTYTITDALGATDSATVIIHVPAADNSVDARDDVYTLTSHNAVTTLDVKANDVDPQGDKFIITGFTQPAHGSVALVNDQFVYTPEAGRTAYDTTFTYTITDALGATDSATVTIHVPAAANSVDAVDDVYHLTNRNQIDLNVKANDTDPQGDAFTITSFTQPDHGTVALVNDEFKYTPDASVRGAYDTTFTYTITDALGATDTATVTIHVDAKPNSVDANPDEYTLPDHTNTFTMNVVVNDTDPQGDTFSISSFTQPTHGSVALVNGEFVYTPEAGRSAYDTTFTYTITDALGATDTTTVTVHVPAAANSVDARDDDYTLPNHSNTFTMNVKANDVDPQGDHFDITGFTQPAHGHVDLVNGQFVYTPDAATRGAYDTSFTYTITDSLGATDSATVTVHVPAAANSVDAVNDSYTMAYNEHTKTLNVVANDKDPQGDHFDITSFTQPAHGHVDLVNGKFVYTASGTGYSTTFNYTITDALGATDTATVTVSVGNPPAPPSGGGNGGGGGDGGGDGCPLVIDLDGDGITMVNHSVNFDLNGDGKADTISNWFGANDGILVHDVQNGSVDGIQNLYGGINQDGFSAFAAKEDTNHDGVVNNQDAGWNNIQIWVDSNGDGKSEAGELHSLSDFGITGISTNADGSYHMDLGSDSYLQGQSTADSANGTLNVYDAWYKDYTLADGTTHGDPAAAQAALAAAMGAPAGDDVAAYNAAAAAAPMTATDAAASTANTQALPEVATYNPDHHA